MKRKIVLGVLLAAELFLVGAAVARWILEKELDVKLLVSALGGLAAILKVSDVGGVSGSRKAQYEAEYRHILGGAFATHHKSKRNKLLKAIEHYNADRPGRALSILSALKKKCVVADDYAAVLIFAALCLTELGALDQAIAAYREALRHDAKRSTAWSNMGILLERKGAREEALSCYENALMYDGENPYAYNNLAAAYYRGGHYEEAIRHAEKALARKSTLYQASNTLCLCYAALGETEESEKYYKISVANGADAGGLRGAIADMQTNMEV